MTDLASRASRLISLFHRLRPSELDGRFEELPAVVSRATRLAGLFAAVDPGSLSGKTVLDLGCGHGHIGVRLEKFGAHVVFVDGRPENIASLKRKFPLRKAFVCDVTSPEVKRFGPRDIVLAFGILYHLADPYVFLTNCSELAPVLFLESQVVDSLDEEVVYVRDHQSSDQALYASGAGVGERGGEWGRGESSKPFVGSLESPASRLHRRAGHFVAPL